MATGWVEVFETRDAQEVELAMEMLRTNGIVSRMNLGTDVSYRDDMGVAATVRVEVRQEDQRAAMDLIKQQSH